MQQRCILCIPSWQEEGILSFHLTFWQTRGAQGVESCQVSDRRGSNSMDDHFQLGLLGGAAKTFTRYYTRRLAPPRPSRFHPDAGLQENLLQSRSYYLTAADLTAIPQLPTHSTASVRKKRWTGRSSHKAQWMPQNGTRCPAVLLSPENTLAVDTLLLPQNF